MRSVGQVSVPNRPAVDEHGTQVRKYETDEAESSKVVVRTTIGLLVVNAFILVKNVLFSAKPTYAETIRPTSEQRTSGASGDSEGEDAGEENALEQGDGPNSANDDDQDMPHRVGSGTTFGLTVSTPVDVQTELAPIYFRGSGHISSSNDNEQLYGAPPGHRIDFRGDSFAMSSHGRSHGGGGHHHGGGSGPHHDDDTSGGHDGHDPDDQDDDDDDDNSHNPGSGSGNTDPPRQNRLPVVLAPLILAALLADEARALTQADLLQNASDLDGDTLTVRDLHASSGTLTPTGDGGWIFQPDPGDTSDVTFTYSISDGTGVTAQTAKLDLLPHDDTPTATVGTAGPDTIIGTPENDVLDGLGGNDLIYGREGNDVIIGGDGDDRLLGGDGDDTIFGGRGNDTIFGGRGNDVIDGGEGDDFADGGEDNDVLHGGIGNDTLLGGDGNDAVSGDDGNDIVMGDAGNDIIDGGAGNDKLDGGDGNDIARGGSGSDEVVLGSGNDIAIAEQGDGDDSYDGGEGVDTYDLSSTSADAVVDLVAWTAVSDDIGSDTVIGFENVNSGSGNDTITGDDQANVVNAGGGSDSVDLGAGDDTVVAQANDGDDAYYGGSGSDTYDASGTSAAADIDLVAQTADSADVGHDTITGFENVNSGSGNDTIVGDDSDNSVNSGHGNDTVDLGGGDDTVIATSGDGDDHYSGGSGHDTYDLSSTSADALIDLISETVTSADVGHDIIVSFENIKGGKGNDVLIANDARNVLVGGEGNDSFEFHSSASIGHGRGYRDQILDFAVGDRIDIDHVRDEFAKDLSDSLDDQNIQRFLILRDQDAVFSRPGELKVTYDNFDGHDVTILQGNTDFDSDAEFELELAGTYVFTDDDFFRA